MSITSQFEHLAGKYIENPIDSLERAVEQSRFPTATEVSLNHPYHRSIIKLRDNGSIDIFAENNNGIRIDRKKLAMNICTGKLIQHINNVRTFINKDLKAEVKGSTKAWFHSNIDIEAKKNADIVVKGNVTVKSDGTIVIEGKNKVEIVSKGPLSIKGSGSVSIESGGNMYFKAKHYDFL